MPRRKRNPITDRIQANDPRVQRALAQASKLYSDFSGHEAEFAREVDAPIAPRVGIVIGYCDGILYSTVRDGKKEDYIHEFAKADRPLFVVSEDGKQIMLYGGNFRFTERGIVDSSDRDSGS